MAEQSSLSWVDRQGELDKIAEFIQDINDETNNRYLLNIIAPVGFGKTSLMRAVWDLYERSLPACRVAFSRYVTASGGFDMSQLLIALIRQLDERIPKRLTALPSRLQRSEEWLAEQFLGLIEAAVAYGKISLLLFDDYGRFPDTDDYRAWFESKILSSAVKNGRVVVILSSERELRFDRLDLRMRLQTYELSSFTEQVVSRTFPRYSGIAADILGVTGGLPTCTQLLVRRLDKLGVQTRAEFQSHQRELVKDCFNSYVRKTVLHSSDTALQDTILALALLRRFDVAVLKELLPHVLPRHYGKNAKVDYFDVIDQLGNNIQWRNQGYTLNSSLRALVETYVLVQRPRFYERVNRVAVDLYRSELAVQYREYCLLELLYHQIALLKLDSTIQPADLQMVIERELEVYIDNQSCAQQLGVQDWDSLRNSLSHDPDLGSFVSTNAARMLQQQIDAHANKGKILSIEGKKVVA